MPGRSYSGGDYRYGFNGMEGDDEIKGIKGSSYDFGARFYDSRIGRWLSQDMMAFKKPYLTPYQSMKNNPIIFLDPDGNDEFIYNMKTGKWTVNINNEPNAYYVYKETAHGMALYTMFIEQHDCTPCWPTVHHGEFTETEFDTGYGLTIATPDSEYTSFYKWARGNVGILELLADTDPELYDKVIGYGGTNALSSHMYNTHQVGVGLFGAYYAVLSLPKALTSLKSLKNLSVSTAATKIRNSLKGFEGKTLIVDENLSPGLTTLLEETGFSVKTFAKGTKDRKIIKWAKENNGVVITNNIKDFKKKEITTLAVSENLKKKDNVYELFERIFQTGQDAANDPGILGPNKNVSLTNVDVE